MITREEVRQNRIKWANFLLNKKRKKATGVLDQGDGARCCLGHGAYCLSEIKKRKNNDGLWFYGEEMADSVAPKEMVEMLGLWSPDGEIRHSSYHFILKNLIETVDINDEDFDFGVTTYDCLAELNDSSGATPQQIGEFLMAVIDGGDETPFKPLGDYPE